VLGFILKKIGNTHNSFIFPNLNDARAAIELFLVPMKPFYLIKKHRNHTHLKRFFLPLKKIYCKKQ